MNRIILNSLTAVILVFSGVSAQFYNTIQHLIGERAAGMAGAYTSLADNSIALWYNPAGLSLMKSQSINVSATSYSYLNSKVKGYRQYEKAGNIPREDLDLKETDFSIVGTSLVYGKRMNDKLGIAFGIFAPIQQNVSNVFGGDIEGFFANDHPTVSIDSVRISSSSNSYSKNYIGLVGAGYKFLDWFQMGVSLGISQYSRVVSTAEYNLYHWRIVNTVQTPNLVFEDKTEELTAYTWFLGGGMKLKIGDHHFLGGNLRTPSLVMTGNRNTTINTESSLSQRERDLEPLAILFESTARGGYSYSIPNDFALSIDIEPAIEAFVLGTGVPFAERPLSYFNILIGAEKKFVDKFWLRGGFLSDMNNKDDIENDDNAQSQIDYFGGTVSISFPKTFDVKDDDGVHNQTLHSSFGIYYRFGSGERRVLRYKDENLYAPQASTVSQNVHNISIFIGESMSF